MPVMPALLSGVACGLGCALVVWCLTYNLAWTGLIALATFVVIWILGRIALARFHA